METFFPFYLTFFPKNKTFLTLLHEFLHPVVLERKWRICISQNNCSNIQRFLQYFNKKFVAIFFTMRSTFIFIHIFLFMFICLTLLRFGDRSYTCQKNYMSWKLFDMLGMSYTSKYIIIEKNTIWCRSLTWIFEIIKFFLLKIIMKW